MRITLNKWRRQVAVTMVEACVVLLLTACLVSVGGCVIVKLCKKLNDQHHEPPQPDDWTTWIDYQVVPGDCAPTGVVIAALQYSSNMQNWQTVASITYTGLPVTVRVLSNSVPVSGFFKIKLQ